MQSASKCFSSYSNSPVHLHPFSLCMHLTFYLSKNAFNYFGTGRQFYNGYRDRGHIFFEIFRRVKQGSQNIC